MKIFSTAASGQTASGTLMPPEAPGALLSGTLAIKTPLLGVKLTAVFILIACVQVSAKTKAQKLTLSFKNGSLENLFTEIWKKTGYVFFYDVATLNGT